MTAICICVPAYGGSVKTGCLASIWNLFGALGTKGLTLSLRTADLADAALARNYLATVALDAKPPFTHLLWIDSDMVVTPPTIQKMLKLNKPIVGCVYPKRTSAGGFVVYGEPAINGETATVDGVGMGVTLVKRAVFETLKASVGTRHCADREVYKFFSPIDDLSEDLSFCKRWRDTGGEIIALLNENVGHVGQFTYRASYLDHVKATATPAPTRVD